MKIQKGKPWEEARARGRLEAWLCPVASRQALAWQEGKVLSVGLWGASCKKHCMVICGTSSEYLEEGQETLPARAWCAG